MLASSGIRTWARNTLVCSLLVSLNLLTACSNSDSTKNDFSREDLIDERTTFDNSSQSENTDQPNSTTKITAATSDESFGYGTAFDKRLNAIGQISSTEFVSLYQDPSIYHEQISWDVTTAAYWDRLMTAPEDLAPLPEGFQPDSQIFEGNPGAYTDFRLNENELALIKSNGFVVSERLGASNFTEIYYRTYFNDLPVFITVDSILHAWHMSFDLILKELESFYFSYALASMLDAMAGELEPVWQTYQDTELADAIREADIYIAVARSLLAGTNHATVLQQDDNQLQEILTKISLAAEPAEIPILNKRTVDFQQFVPTGHYTESAELQAYFQAIKWFGQVDLRINGIPEQEARHEFTVAVVLYFLLQQGNQYENWAMLDEALESFIGIADGMGFKQLATLLASLNIDSLADVAEDINAVHQSLAAGDFGIQEIQGTMYAPLGVDAVSLPRSFAVINPRFTLDAWSMQKTSSGAIEWEGKDVLRYISQGLDPVFSVLDNRLIVDEIARRIEDQDGVPWRDGLNYQHNLAAVKDVIDSQSEQAWSTSIYMDWLATLRTLSQSTSNNRFPEAFRTEAWAWKTLDTQLASWTELRHDTALYVDSPVTTAAACFYPEGYVEPKLEFWRQLKGMLDRAKANIANIEIPDISFRGAYLQVLQERQHLFFNNFSEKVTLLESIASKQLLDEELDDSEKRMLRDVVEIYDDYNGYRSYNGWYPKLYYNKPRYSMEWDALTTTVHTTKPGEDFAGYSLQQAVGNVHLMVIAIESEDDRVVYLGPTYSHYEINTQQVLNDTRWKETLQNLDKPTGASWQKRYLVNGDPENIGYGISGNLLTAMEIFNGDEFLQECIETVDMFNMPDGCMDAISDMMGF